MKSGSLAVLLFGLGVCALTTPVAAREGPTTVFLASAISTALSRDALVREAQQDLADARATLVRARAHTVAFSASVGSSASSSAGLDPQSEITGTDFSSWEYGTALAMPLPGGAQVGLTTSATASTTNSALRAGGGMSYTYAGTNVGLNYAQPLPVLRNEKVLTEGRRWSAELAVQQAELALAEAKRQVAAATLDHFFACLRAQRQIEIAQADQQDADELLRIAREKFQRGKLAEIEVMEAKVAASRAQVNARSTHSAAQGAFDALKNFLGVPFEEEVSVSYEPTRAQAPALEENALVAKAFSRRPDLQKLELGLKLGDLLVRQAESASRPGIFLTSNYNLSGQGPSITESWSRVTNPSWFAGLAASVNLTRTEDQAAITQARSHLRFAQEEQRLRTEEVRLEIRDLIRRVQDAADAAGVLADTVTTAEENLRVRHTQLERGLIRPIEVAQTERELMETRDQYLDARIDYELAKAKLTLAVGEMLPEGGLQ